MIYFFIYVKYGIEKGFRRKFCYNNYKKKKISKVNIL